MIRKSHDFSINDRGFKQDMSIRLNSSRQIKKSQSEVPQIWKFSALDFYRFYYFADKPTVSKFQKEFMNSSFLPKDEPNIVKVTDSF